MKQHYLIAIVALFVMAGSAFAQTKAVSTYGKFEKPKDYVTIKPGTVSVGVGAYYSGQKDFSSGILVKYFLNESIALRGSLQFGRNFAKGPNPEYIGQGEGSDTEFQIACLAIWVATLQ